MREGVGCEGASVPLWWVVLGRVSEVKLLNESVEEDREWLMLAGWEEASASSQDSEDYRMLTLPCCVVVLYLPVQIILC